MEVIPDKTVLPIPDALSATWMKEKSTDSMDPNGVSLSTHDDKMSTDIGIGTFHHQEMVDYVVVVVAVAVAVTAAAAVVVVVAVVVAFPNGTPLLSLGVCCCTLTKVFHMMRGLRV